MKNLLLVTLLLSCVSLVYCQKSKTPPIDDSLTESSLSGKQVLASQESPTDNTSQRRAFFRCVHPDNAPLYLSGEWFARSSCLRKYSQSITLKDCEATADKGHHEILHCLEEFIDRISQAKCENLRSRVPIWMLNKYFLSTCNKNNDSDAQEDNQNIDVQDNISP